MIEILIISAVITAKLFAVDRQYAKNGQVPPGYRLIERWLDARKAKGLAPQSAKPAKYGMLRYFWQRWQATWEGVTDEARIRDAALKKERAEAAAKGWVPPKGPTLKEQAAADWKWVIDRVTPSKGKQETPGGPQDYSTPLTLADVMGGAEPEPVAPAEGDATVCGACGQALTVRDGAPAHPSSNGCPKQPTAPAEPAVGDEPTDPKPEAAAPADGDINTLKENTMTTSQSGEVTGIRSAIAFADAMASAHSEHASNEGYLSSLGNMEVGAEDVNSAQAAMEASANAAAMWAAHSKGLASRNSAVSEAYSSSPGAGNKQAQINE